MNKRAYVSDHGQKPRSGQREGRGRRWWWRGVGGAFGIPAHYACVRSPRQRTARWRSKLHEGANLPALLAAFGAGKGHFVRMISEDDSGASTTELQVEEDNELPIIQLCGLVEEFRYPPAGSWGRPLLPLWARSSTETIQVRT